MIFLRALFHAKDPAADSIVLGGLVLLVTLCALSGFDVVVQGREFSAFNFASAGAAILAGLGSGKRIRDGASDVRP